MAKGCGIVSCGQKLEEGLRAFLAPDRINSRAILISCILCYEAGGNCRKCKILARDPGARIPGKLL